MRKELEPRCAVRNCFLDRYQDLTRQAIGHIYPVPGNGPRSLFERLLGPIPLSLPKWLMDHL